MELVSSTDGHHHVDHEAAARNYLASHSQQEKNIMLPLEKTWYCECEPVRSNCRLLDPS